MARPTKLDDVRAQKILQCIRSGGSRASAAGLAGINPATLTDWMARGKSGEAPFDAFYAGIKAADAHAEQEMVGIVREAAKMGTWQAAAWWLERRRHKTYALKRDMKLEVTQLSEEQARARYKELTGKEWGT